MRLVNRIRETKRKKKVKMTFKSSFKRGCTYGESVSQTNLQDANSQHDVNNDNNELSMTACGQSGYLAVNGNKLYFYCI